MSLVQRLYGNRATQHAMRFPQVTLFPSLTALDRAFTRARKWWHMGKCCGACGGKYLHRPSCRIGFVGRPMASWQLVGPEHDALRARGLI